MIGEIDMIKKPLDILEHFPIRRTDKQKQNFRESVCHYVSELGLPCRVEESKKNCHNIVIGDLQSAKCLVTAHYDTPASIGIPNVMIPCNMPLFIMYQLLIVAFFFLIAFVFGGVAWLICHNEEVAFFVGYIAYFGTLFLMLHGPANRNNVNDNSSGVITLLESAKALPPEARGNVCFVLFDKEEYGLVGSKAFRKNHKAETENMLVLNLDCVGDGDHILFFPTKKLRKDLVLMERLSVVNTSDGNKTIKLWDKSAMFNSDQKSYPLGVGIAAFHKKKIVGYCCGRIHTRRDTILDQENVNILRDQMLKIFAD